MIGSSRPQRASRATPGSCTWWVDRVSLGNVARSTMSTFRSRRASSIAVGAPATRAPTMITSYITASSLVVHEEGARSPPGSARRRLEAPGHRGGGRVGTAGARRHALPQVAGQRRMHGLEPADDVPDPGGDRLAGTFGLVAEQAGRPARSRHGGQLAQQHVPFGPGPGGPFGVVPA